MIKNIDGFLDSYKVSKNTAKFLEWARCKFNIEEIHEAEYTYTELVNILDIRKYTTLQAKENQLESLGIFADFEKVNRKKIRISNPKYIMFSDCSIDLKGCYQDIFSILFYDWLNTKKPESFFYLSEDIALEMGLLKIPYRYLSEYLYGSKTNYSIIHGVDRQKRIYDLIDAQLLLMVKNSMKGKHFHYVTRVPMYHELVLTEDENGFSYLKVIPTSEVKDPELLTLFEQCKNDATRHPRLDKIRMMWKIIRPIDKDWIPLNKEMKDFLINILLINKQDKVYKRLMKVNGINAHYSNNIEDLSIVDNEHFREDLYDTEIALDGSSLYKVIELDEYNEFTNEKKVDYVRQANSKELKELRKKIKNNTSIKKIDDWSFIIQS